MDTQDGVAQAKKATQPMTSVAFRRTVERAESAESQVAELNESQEKRAREVLEWTRWANALHQHFTGKAECPDGGECFGCGLRRRQAQVAELTWERDRAQLAAAEGMAMVLEDRDAALARLEALREAAAVIVEQRGWTPSQDEPVLDSNITVPADT